jgi:hypothetical protein
MLGIMDQIFRVMSQMLGFSCQLLVVRVHAGHCGSDIGSYESDVGISCQIFRFRLQILDNRGRVFTTVRCAVGCSSAHTVPSFCHRPDLLWSQEPSAYWLLVVLTVGM